MPTNAWGEEVAPEERDEFWVPPEERKDVDEGDQSDALTEETGDDMDGFNPDEESP